MRDAPVLIAVADKPTHVAVHVLEEEAPKCSLYAHDVLLHEQLDEGHNVGSVDHVCLLHNVCYARVHLINLHTRTLMSSALSPASFQTSLDQQTLEAAMKSIAQVPTCIAHEKATIDVACKEHH